MSRSGVNTLESDARPARHRVLTALITVLGTVFISTFAIAGPASAGMNQASTAFYDAVGFNIFHVPIYRGTFTIVPYGSGTHVTKLHWQNTSSSSICTQKADFTAYDGQNRQMWKSIGNGVFGPPCRHDYTGNRPVDLSSAGAAKICGTLYFARGTTGSSPDWYRKVTTCSIM